LKAHIKLPKKKTIKEVRNYFLKNGLKVLIDLNKSKRLKKDMRFEKNTYKPELNDLYRLHQIIILNKRISVLEYGTGWSSLVISHALKLNEKKYKNKIKDLRFKKKFSLSVLDNERKFLKISKNRLKKYLKKNDNTFFYYSQNAISKYNRRICSHFVKHPRINPDFIYVDGPDQFKIRGNINNLTISDYEMMPMNSDLLSFENFLTPGTIILFDGRTANARFLRSNFKRKWEYIEDKKNDQNLLYLNEAPLGKINKKQINFYKG
tara:strand:- start:98 stop:889 length:792 start_codon:yes stop_codon:yes gene_type:complete